MSKYDNEQEFQNAVNAVRGVLGLSPIDYGGATQSNDSSVVQADSGAPLQQNNTSLLPGGTNNSPTAMGDSDLLTDKWYAGDTPTYLESVAQLARIKDKLTDEQYNEIATQLEAWKNSPDSGRYNNYYTTATSPFIADIAKRGIDVSGGITEEWIKKYEGLMDGARYTDVGSTVTKPTQKSPTSEWLAYDYFNIVEDYNQTKTVLDQVDKLHAAIDYWVNRDDLNLSDQQILDLLDFDGDLNYLKGLNDSQRNPESSNFGKRWDYTAPIDYNPDYLLGYIWAARNGGGTGDPERDTVLSLLGRGNVWQENKEISDKLDYYSENYNPYAVKSTLDQAAQYFGVREFSEGWAEEAAKTIIDWNNKDDVKYLKQVAKAEEFTKQAETEKEEIYRRIDEMINDWLITDPEKIAEGLWDKGYDGSDALTALKKLDNSLLWKDGLLDTTRPIDYSKKDVLAYIEQECEKASKKETLPTFSDNMAEIMSGSSLPAGVSAPNVAPTNFEELRKLNELQQTYNILNVCAILLTVSCKRGLLKICRKPLRISPRKRLLLLLPSLLPQAR